LWQTKNHPGFKIMGIIRYIRIFFLLIAVAILNAHIIIPHDHHQSDSDLCQENKYPVTQDKSNHHPVFPTHCHAFNDLATEKAVTYNLIKYIKCLDFIPGSVLIPVVSNLNISGEKTHDLFVFPIDSRVKESASLRAPPSLI
jgi:hypothetical protein